MTALYFALGYLGLFAGTVALLVVLRARSSQERTPFPDNTRLLRAPGESLRRRLVELDEKLLDQFVLTIGLPAVAYGALLYLSAQLRADHPYLALTLVWLGLAGLLAAFYTGARRLIGLIDLRRNLRLGYFGERVVAEHMEPLKAAGHRIFHDIPAGDPPAGSSTAPDNIDHIVVGPAGVFAIETKTRRKGRARVGFMAHEIIFDGTNLAFPWGEDRHGLDQAHRQAEWLARFLAGQTGRTVPVHALLVFPGWTILRKGRSPVHVLAPRELPAFIARPPSEHTGFVVPPLDPAAIDLVARQLEARCRDVEL
jgi:hypothetical protein